MKSIGNRIKEFLYRLHLMQHLGIQLVSGLLVSLLCLGAFSSIAEDVAEKERILQIDQAVANALHASATPFSTSVWQAISQSGIVGVWLLGLIFGIIFIHRHQRVDLIIGIITLVGGVGLNTILKLIFARQRPYFIDPLAVEQSFSFPSGHAMIGLIGYGLFAYFIWRGLHNGYGRILLIFAATALILLIGVSRITLGVHFLSDVVAGFAAGGVWLAACITALTTSEHRKNDVRRIES